MIDKDRATALLAREIGATVFVCATDADAVYLDWGKPGRQAVARATPDAMDEHSFPAGSMGPKVEAAQEFARATGGRSIICALADVPAAVQGREGNDHRRRFRRRRDRVSLRIAPWPCADTALPNRWDWRPRSCRHWSSARSSRSLSPGAMALDRPGVYAKLVWNTKFWPLGPTGFGIDYPKGENIGSDGADGKSYGIAAVQKIERYNIDLYSQLRWYELDAGTDPDLRMSSWAASAPSSRSETTEGG